MRIGAGVPVGHADVGVANVGVTTPCLFQAASVPIVPVANGGGTGGGQADSRDIPIPAGP